MKECYKKDNFLFKDLNQPIEKFTDKKSQGGLGQKDASLFFGFWGTIFNEILDLPLNENILYVKKWRKYFFDEEDIRFMDKNEKKKILKEKNVKWIFSEKPSKRFFIVSGNIDHEVKVTGKVYDKEYYEVNGNIREWQCSKKCCNKCWLIDDKFRFQVEKDDGKAPPIKYVSRSNIKSEVPKTLFEKYIDEKKKSKESYNYGEFSLGDEEEFNYKHPRGFFDYSIERTKKIAKKKRKELKKNYQTNQIANQRTMYYRYFNPKISQHSTNPKSFYPKDNDGVFEKKVKSIKPSNEILSSFNENDVFTNNLTQNFGEINFIDIVAEDEGEIMKEALAMTKKQEEEIKKEKERKEKEKEKKKNFEEDEDLLEEEKEEEEERKSTAAFEDEERRKQERIKEEEKKVLRKENNYMKLLIKKSERIHDKVHKKILGKSKNISIGLFKPIVVDPMIHHHSYLSEVNDSTKIIVNPVYEGSSSFFNISLRVFDKDNQAETIKIFLPSIRSTIVKKDETTEIFNDRIILSLSDFKIEDSTLPNNGEVSLLVENLISKKQFTKEIGNVGKSVRKIQLPWQLHGEYSITQYKPNKQERLFGIEKMHLIIDYVLIDDTEKYKLTLRCVQKPNLSTSISNIFIDFPISNFKRNIDADPSSRKPSTQISFLQKSENSPLPTTNIPLKSQDSFKPLPDSSIGEDKTESKIPIQPINDQRLKPVLNRIICPSCHSLGRPRIKMGNKDPRWVRSPVARYKNFTKNVIKGLQEEPGLSLLILELGCGPKLRKLSEGLLKQTKMHNSRLIRIDPFKLMEKETKKQKAEDENILVIKESVSRSLKKVDTYISMLSEKVGCEYPQ